MSAKEPPQLRNYGSRRSALATLGSAAALGSLVIVGMGTSREPDLEALLFAGLSRDHLARMGQGLRGEFAEQDRRSLVAAALSDIGLSASAIVRHEARSIAERRAAAIQRDFDQGRTVKIDGWLLARTEVRLAVLAAHSIA